MARLSIEGPEEPVFWEKVRLLFHTRSFGGYDLSEINSNSCCVGTYQNEDLEEESVMVRCDDNLGVVDKQSIEEFIKICEKYKASNPEKNQRLFYVVDKFDRFSEEVIKYCQDLELINQEFKLKDEAQLIRELVDFRPYLNEIIKEYESRPIPYSIRDNPPTLAETYVPPNFIIQDSPSNYDSLNDFIDSWLSKHSPSNSKFEMYLKIQK